MNKTKIKNSHNLKSAGYWKFKIFHGLGIPVHDLLILVYEKIEKRLSFFSVI